LGFRLARLLSARLQVSADHFVDNRCCESTFRGDANLIKHATATRRCLTSGLERELMTALHFCSTVSVHPPL